MAWDSTAPDLRPTRSTREYVYSRLPRGLQTLALSAEGLRVRRERYGGDFSSRLTDYLSRETALDDEILAVRRRKLRELLVHAATHVPYWGRTLREAGIDPARVDGPNDLTALPVLTKADVLRLGAALVSTAVRPSVIRKVHTSGTTGAGLVFLTTVDAVRDQWAVWWRFRIRHGVTPDLWQATFAGRSIVPGGRRDPRPWRVNWATRQVLFSQYHLNSSSAPAYAAALDRWRLPWYHGYPSFLSLLAELFERKGHRCARPRAITLGAENVLAGQRRAIAEAFGAAPVTHYGLAEAVANFSECPSGRYHVDEDFAAVEFLPAENGAHRILGTALTNFAMPFIRYDTGDLARLAPGPCGCGRPGRIVESIDGRSEDYVELNDGTRVGRLDHLFKDAVRVAEAQIRQSRRGRCTIAVVPREGYAESDTRALLDECRSRFGERLEARVDLVDVLPRTAGGKLRLVVRTPSEAGSATE